MPITTYLQPLEYVGLTSDREINNLLKKVRDQRGEHYRVEERILTTKRLFRQPQVNHRYSVYLKLDHEGFEFQVINFYNPRSDTSINTVVTADVVAAYFYGILTRFQMGTKPLEV